MNNETGHIVWQEHHGAAPGHPDTAAPLRGFASRPFVPAPALWELPTIIDAPGKYRTRCGEVVEVTVISPYGSSTAPRCIGLYSDGETLETWRTCGRVFAGQESQNDIIGKVAQ